MNNKVFYNEKYRPQFHFSSKNNWLNDPNGLVVVNDVYHLFYQYNPFGNKWGNMHWGHATSKDLVHWEQQPIALHAGDSGDEFIFSGSAIFDENNDSQLGTIDNPPMIAFFTFSGNERNNQRQAVAYSLDEGTTWLLYEGNPIIENPGVLDFRDPKVFWHQGVQRWVMLVAAGRNIFIYQSKNLLDWDKVSSFGNKHGRHGGDWECPDLFPLLMSDNEIKWVLLISVSPGAPNGGGATQYFLGHFDGANFIADKTDSDWIDWGPDSFAGITWEHGNKSDSKIYIAWMNNWMYANNTPTDPWNGQMTVPRELSLSRTLNGIKLLSKPHHSLHRLRKNEKSLKDISLCEQQSHFVTKVGNCLEGQFELEVGKSTGAGFSLTNTQGEEVQLYVDISNQRLVIDRSKTLNVSSFPQYNYVYYANLPEINNRKLDIHFLKDSSSIEVFLFEGEIVMTALLYTKYPLTDFNCFSFSGESLFQNGKIWELKSIW